MDRASRKIVIPYIKDLLDQGLNYYEIAEKLNSAGYYPRRHKIWESDKVRRFALKWKIISRDFRPPKKAAGQQLELPNEPIQIQGSTNKEAAEATAYVAADPAAKPDAAVVFDQQGHLIFKLAHAKNLSDSEARLLIKKVFE